MGCFQKLLFIGLTAAIAYQACYNWRGAHELGGKYLDLEHLFYSVFSLVPAILLGIHATKLACARDSQHKLELASSRRYKWVTSLYALLFGAMVAFRLFAHFQHSHQLGREHIVSYERSRKWLIYYWGVLQYGLTFVLCAAYRRVCHKIVKHSAAKQCKKEHDLLPNQLAAPSLDHATLYH